MTGQIGPRARRNRRVLGLALWLALWLWVASPASPSWPLTVALIPLAFVVAWLLEGGL